jgi:carboxymethylenebutenolidase
MLTVALSGAVHFPFEGQVRPGYLALPEAPALVPAVVVVHELYGLNANIRRIAERFATHGYAALAVDLFAERSRVVCLARMLAGSLTDALNHVGVRELRAALSFLADHPAIDGVRLGAAGYCLGGGLVLALGCADKRL